MMKKYFELLRQAIRMADEDFGSVERITLSFRRDSRNEVEIEADGVEIDMLED